MGINLSQENINELYAWVKDKEDTHLDNADKAFDKGNMTAWKTESIQNACFGMVAMYMESLNMGK